ncbi:MAG: response regulator, partial [Acidobacteriota bacterium]
MNSAGTRSGPAVAIRAGRMVAIVVLAVGVEQALAIAAPGMIPRSWIYLAAAALVAVLEGFGPGIGAALLSGAAYAFLQPGSRGWPDALGLTLISSAVAIIAALATSRMRANVTARARERSRNRRLLNAVPVVAVPVQQDGTSLEDTTLVAWPEPASVASTIASETPSHFTSEPAEDPGPSAEYQLRMRVDELERGVADAAQRESLLRRAMEASADDRTSALQQARNLAAQMESMQRATTTATAKEGALRESLAVISSERDTVVQRVRSLEERVRQAEAAASSASAAQLAARQELARLTGEQQGSSETARSLAGRVQEVEAALDLTRRSEQDARDEMAAIVNGRDAALGQAHSLATHVEELERLLSEANESAGDRDADAVETKIRAAELERSVSEARLQHDEIAERLAQALARIAELEPLATGMTSHVATMTEDHSRALAARDAALARVAQLEELAAGLPALEGELQTAAARHLETLAERDSALARAASLAPLPQRLQELEAAVATAAAANAKIAAERDEARTRLVSLEPMAAQTRERDTALTTATALRKQALDERDVAVARIGELKRALATAAQREAALDDTAGEHERLRAAHEQSVARIGELERALTMAAEREAGLRVVASQHADLQSAHQAGLAQIAGLEGSLSEFAKREAEASESAAAENRRLGKENERAVARIAQLEQSLGEANTARENDRRAAEEHHEAIVSKHDYLLAAHDASLVRNRELETQAALLVDREAALGEARVRHERLTSELAIAVQRIEESGSSLAAAAQREALLQERTQHSAEVEQHRDAAVSRIVELEQALTHSSAREALLSATAEEAAALAKRELERLEDEWSAKLEIIVSNLASDHEADLGKAMEEREEARASLRELTNRLHAAQQHAIAERTSLEEEWNAKLLSAAGELAAERESASRASKEHEAAGALAQDLGERLQALAERAEAERLKLEDEQNAKLQTTVANLASGHEADIGQAILERDEARTQLRDLTTRLHALQADFGTERTRMETEWSEKLQSIVSNLATDHEADLGQALLEKLEARAESRNLNMKLTQVQQQADHLQEMLEAERRRMEEEWNVKLQSIVNNLASDHETDVGHALMEREEARAAARDLTKRLQALQQRLEADHEQFSRVQTRWKEQQVQLENEHRRLLANVRAAAQAEIAALRAALVGHKPPPGSRPVVLIVQQEESARAASKKALESIGYETLVASDGLEALRMASASHPALVLADSSMPKVDGAELVQFLKSRPETALITVVLIGNSASASDEDVFPAAG